MIITYKFLSEQPTKKVLTANGQVIEFSPYYTTQDTEIAEQLRKLYWLRELERTDTNLEAESSTEPLPDSIVRRTSNGCGKFADPIEENDATSKGYVDTLLARKADKTDVAATLARKADKANVDAALAQKAEKLDVDAALAQKMNEADVYAALDLKQDKGDYASVAHRHEFGDIENIPYATTDNVGLIRIATDDEQFTENDSLAVSPKTAHALKTMIENIESSGGQMAELKIITETDDYAVRTRYITINFLLTGLNKDAELSPMSQMKSMEIVPVNDNPMDSRNHIESGANLFTTIYPHIAKKVEHYKFSPHVRITDKNMSKAFYMNSKVKSVDFIPDGVTNIENIFRLCNALVAAPTFPEGITSLLETFYNCTSLANVPDLPKGIANMDSTFYNCTSLVNAPKLAHGVTTMNSTFTNCTSLVTAPEIPSTVTSMNHTFSNCTSLVNVPNIPNSVSTMIYAFSGCKSLLSAPALPKNVTNISYLFNNCAALVNAPAIPSNVANMSYIFNNCSSLKRAMIPDHWNMLTTAVLTYPFLGCASMKTLVILEDHNKIQVGATTFTGLPTTVNIYVKDSQLEAYKTNVPNFSATLGSRCLPLSELPAEENIWNINTETGAI